MTLISLNIPRLKRTAKVQKLEWLRANPEAWRDLPLSRAALSHRELFEKMQSANLFSPATNWSDVNLHKLVTVVSREISQP